MARIIPFAVAFTVLIASCGKKEVKLSAEEAGPRDIVETVSASGKVQPEVEVKITSEVSGQIIELPVKEGDVVGKGDLLLRINPDIYESALNRADAALSTARSNLANAKARRAQAKAQFNVAKLTYDRNQKLFQQGAIAQSEWDNAQSNYQVAEAEVEAAEENVRSGQFSIQSAEASKREAADNLSRTIIRAPQAGTVTALTKEVGEMVLGNQMMAGETIMKVSQLDQMEVNVEVNESDIVRVHMGDTATVEVDAFQDESFRGVVTEIGNTALNAIDGMSLGLDQVTNFSVKIRVLPASYQHLCDHDSTCVPFRPGMSATVEIETANERGVLAVPIRAVTTRLDISKSGSTLDRIRAKKEAEEEGEAAEPEVCLFVYDAASGKVEVRAIETGVQDSRFIQILGGVDSGEQVITGPYNQVSKQLSDGDAVEVKGTGKKQGKPGEEPS